MIVMGLPWFSSVIQQGVQGDAVLLPGRGVSPQNPFFPRPPQAARVEDLNSCVHLKVEK